MALLWADGFDHYGGITARLLDRVYSSIEGVTLSTTARTGSYSARVQVAQNNSGMRRVLPYETDMVGLAFSFNVDELPTDTRSMALCQMLTKTNSILLTVSVFPTGAIAVRSGGWTGTILAETGPEIVMPNSYQHFEIAINGSNLEIRVNGVTYLNITDLALTSPIGQVMVAGCYGFPKTGAVGVYMYVDDLVCWDDTGASFNTWVGDKKVYLRMPDEDGPDQDWTPSTGSNAWPILDNVPPVDSEYVTATEAGDRVSVGIDAFNTDIVAIAGVYVVGRVWKTDAGNAKISIDMVSGSEETDPVSIPVTNAPVWYGRAFEVDPNTGMPWTVSGINDALVRIERIE